MEKIVWGIIGCGDVCEVKSGPAFSKIDNSYLQAVMRRDGEKAKDFAKRHNVDEYYSSGDDIINHKEINAVYIATPPAYHEFYAIKAMEAGKSVYIEKPLTLNAKSCEKLIECARQNKVKATGAYYRRKLPLFLKVKEIIENKELGDIRCVNIKTFVSPTKNKIANSEEFWRVDPNISGGGLFHDIAPHQLDIIYWLLGAPIDMIGKSINQTNNYEAPDVINFNGYTKDNILINGVWLFNVHNNSTEDSCQIIGENGFVEFSFFNAPKLKIMLNNNENIVNFSNPEHIQQPMISSVVRYFMGKEENPCSLEEALISMKMLDSTI